MRMTARSRVDEAFGASVAGYAAGFLPLPLLVTAWLLLTAHANSRTGSVSVLWVLLSCVPAALVLAPWNVHRTLVAYGDAHAAQTARASAAFGLLGLVVQALALVPLLYLGWIGLVLDVALPVVFVPGLARQQLLSRLDEERIAARLRRRQTRTYS
jgi:hypothetical protein